MKKLVLTLMICSFFAATGVFGQQWSGPDNTTGGINRSGNVGIGISTPASRLDIKSDEYPVLGGGYDYVPQLRLQSYAFHQHTASYLWDIKATSSLEFLFGSSSNSLTPVFSLNQNILTYNGNKLVIGTGENRYNLGFAMAPSGNQGHYLAFGANNSGGSSAWSFTGNSSNNGGSIIHGDNQGNLFFITRGTDASNIMNTAQTAANVKMKIGGNGDISIGANDAIQVLNNGNIGIGTTTPNKKLHIKDGEILVEDGRLLLSDGDNQIELKSDGLIHAREIEVDLVTIPDYVFEDDYDLMPLTELQKFINLNRHLPNIKSAAEYEAHGSIPLKELNLKLLEKVEELTLYTLEQEKRLSEQQAQLEQLQRQVTELMNNNSKN